MKKIIPTNAILIPDNASEVFTGQIFSVHQWPQKMFDGTTKTFEMLKRPDAVATLAVKDNKLVILEEEQPILPPYFGIPIGRHDVPGESTLEGAKRELFEETGLSFKKWKLIRVSQPITKMEWFVYFYLATEQLDEQPSTPEADGEKITVMLKTFDEAKALASHPRNRHIPREIFEAVDSLEELLNLPEFQGKEVDR